jgi:hypothetical protein
MRVLQLQEACWSGFYAVRTPMVTGGTLCLPSPKVTSYPLSLLETGTTAQHAKHLHMDLTLLHASQLAYHVVPAISVLHASACSC